MKRARPVRHAPRVRVEPPAPAATEKLHKFLAQAGFGSRRDMEQWIRAGRVMVNGAVATLGSRVGPGDVVKVAHRTLRVPAARRTPRVLVYHKPEGEIVSQDDPSGRPSVFEHLPRLRGAKWIAIGRLDFNTCGLLIFTDSGELAHRLMHPRFEVEREYAVRVRGQLNAEQLARLTGGVALEDGPARFDRLEPGGGEGSNQWFRVMLREGRHRIVRRMFDAVGATVSRLMRVRFGPVSLPPRVKRGQHRELEEAEVRAVLQWIEERGGANEAPRAARVPE